MWSSQPTFFLLVAFFFPCDKSKSILGERTAERPSAEEDGQLWKEVENRIGKKEQQRQGSGEGQRPWVGGVPTHPTRKLLSLRQRGAISLKSTYRKEVLTLLCLTDMTQTEILSLKMKAARVKLLMCWILDSEGSWAGECWLSPWETDAPSGFLNCICNHPKQFFRVIVIKEIYFLNYASQKVFQWPKADTGNPWDK